MPRKKTVKDLSYVRYYVYDGSGIRYWDNLIDAKNNFMGLDYKKCGNGYKSLGVDYNTKNRIGALDILAVGNTGIYKLSMEYKKILNTESDIEILEKINNIIKSFKGDK